MHIDLLVKNLRNATQGASQPMSVDIAARYQDNAFPVLISCLLSLRSKDLVTLPVAIKLLDQASTPEQMLTIPVAQLEQIIYSVNYYKKKAQQLHDVSEVLLHRFSGKVPNNKKDLLSIKGVGIKTANLVLAEAFNIPAICVDIHVHRISNRLGLIHTKTPEETEQVLHQLLPKKYWIEWNRLLVKLGQTICSPQSPHCSICPLSAICQKVGVTKSR